VKVLIVAVVVVVVVVLVVVMLVVVVCSRNVEMEGENEIVLYLTHGEYKHGCSWFVCHALVLCCEK